MPIRTLPDGTKVRSFRYEQTVSGNLRVKKAFQVKPITRGKNKVKSNFFAMEHASVVDTGLINQVLQQFAASNEDMDIYGEQFKFIVNKEKHPIFEVIKEIRTVVGGRIVMPDNTYAILMGPRFLCAVNINERHNENTEDVHNISVSLYGESTEVSVAKKGIEELFKAERQAKIKWWFEGRHGPETRDIYLPAPKTKIYPEYYPGLGDPAEFMSGYMNGDAAVLLLSGPPGTGKTTLLRHLILENKMSAHVIYEEKLMERDNVFQNFLFEDDSEILVIEDADTILSDRDRSGNRMMARFLSVSDGLIKLPNKKLVFTTNISDYGRIDEALLRPGRCYAHIRTRELSFIEAQNAARRAEKTPPNEKRAYSLAEVFHPEGGSEVRKVGFI